MRPVRVWSPLARAAAAAGVADARVLEALARVRRADFVPAVFQHRADADAPIPIADEQVTTQPSLVAKMVEALQLGGAERVLEIGTGLGYQAAVLSQLAAEVVTIEWFADLADEARRLLAAAKIANVLVVQGNGALGCPEKAPFDAIVVAAASPDVPEALVRQLVEGGRLVQPIGPGGSEVVTAFRKRGGELAAERVVTGAYFVPLLGSRGAPTPGTEATSGAP